MAIGSVRVQSGDVISATLMNHILEQLEELTGGAPADLEQLKQRIQDLEGWRSLSDPQIGKVTGIDARLAAAETSITSLQGLAARVTALELLPARVAALEALLQVAGKVRISGFDPAAQVPVGQVLTILGAGFKTPVAKNLVFINNTPIYNFRLDSDASRLRVVVPTTIPGVTPVPSGAPVTVRVSNDDGEAERPYAVTPALSAPGNAPLIVEALDDNTQNPLLRMGQIAHVLGRGFGDFSNLPTVRFIYMTDVGPAVYTLNSLFSVTDTLLRFTVPNILEAPLSGTFGALLEIDRGNHVSALAQVTMTRMAS